MLKFSAICCLVIGSAAASAGDYKFINADGSALGKLCIAAAESPGKAAGTLASLAVEFGVSPVEVSAVSCNGESLASFANRYAADKTVTIRTYVVNLGDQSPESQLCLASLVSAEEYAKLKEANFKYVYVEREIMCNGMPFNQFVEKYRDRLATPASAKAEVASR